MSPHFWIEFRGARKIAVFLAAIILVALFWWTLPDELRKMALHRAPRRAANLPALMAAAWIGGWFILLFLRGEDLQVLAPFNYQTLIRVIAVALLSAAVAIAGFFSVSCLA